MKMFIPKQDKVKRLLLLQLDAQVPEEEDHVIGHGIGGKVIPAKMA
jgi:hypothetical protein